AGRRTRASPRRAARPAPARIASPSRSAAERRCASRLPRADADPAGAMRDIGAVTDPLSGDYGEATRHRVESERVLGSDLREGLPCVVAGVQLVAHLLQPVE